MGIGVVESSRHLCGHASTISDVIRLKDSTKIKDLTLIHDTNTLQTFMGMGRRPACIRTGYAVSWGDCNI
jgi:hypothetical protein